MENIEFSITPEDYENSGKNFTDICTCPCATAIKRIFPNNVYVGVGPNLATVLIPTADDKIVRRDHYHISPHFYKQDMVDVIQGETKKHTLTLISSEEIEKVNWNFKTE